MYGSNKKKSEATRGAEAQYIEYDCERNKLWVQFPFQKIKYFHVITDI